MYYIYICIEPNRYSWACADNNKPATETRSPHRGYASGMDQVRVGYESGVWRRTHRVIALCAKLGEGGFGAHLRQ